MVQIYNEITIYFYKAIFASGASPTNPCWGPACPQTPQPGGWTPRTPQRGYPPSAPPRVEECTYFWGVNTSWGIDTVESKGPLHQEDNQAPQPTLSSQIILGNKPNIQLKRWKYSLQAKRKIVIRSIFKKIKLN